MAKVFNKDLHQFTKSDHAKDFIESCKKPAFAGLLGIKSFINECLKKENSPFLNIEKEEELCVSRQKSGISAFAAFFIIN
jgi:hypothetical protein